MHVVQGVVLFLIAIFCAISPAHNNNNRRNKLRQQQNPGVLCTIIDGKHVKKLKKTLNNKNNNISGKQTHASRRRP